PAAADVLAPLMAVVQNVGAGAAGFLQGVTEDREFGKAPFFIDRLSECWDVTVLPGEPVQSYSHRSKRITCSFAKQVSLSASLKTPFKSSPTERSRITSQRGGRGSGPGCKIDVIGNDDRMNGVVHERHVFLIEKLLELLGAYQAIRISF